MTARSDILRQLPLEDAWLGLATITYRFHVTALCPFVDEVDHHSVVINFVGREDKTVTLEAHSIDAYVAAWRQERVSVEDLTTQMWADFTEALGVHELGPDRDLHVEVQVSTQIGGVFLETYR